jgi:outer membrane protein assembly factor BamB
LLAAVIICLVGSLQAAEAPSANWPMQRGTAAGDASGTCPDLPGGLRDWAFQGPPKQVFQRGVPVWASPAFAVVQGRPCAFIGGCDQTMYALDLAARRRVWSKITNGSIVDSPCVAQVAGQQVVFWGASDRFVYAHAAADGRAIWTRELVEPTNTQGQARIPAPFCDGDVLYVACFVYDKAMSRSRQDAWLFALDPVTGKVLWRRELAHGQVNAPIGCRIGDELFLYVAARKGVLQAFRVSRQGLTAAWSFQMPHEVMGSPAVLEGEAPMVFLGSKFGDLVAIDAKTGQERWHRMTGNWVDNNACVGLVAGRPTVFVGSNDYSLYALRADDGEILWRRPLGGEVYTAPCLFAARGRSFVAAACLDDRLYVVDAASGKIESSFYTGQPTWDKIAKGETLWGSPIAVTAGDSTAIVHGSYDGAVYLFPLSGDSRFRARPQGDVGLWIGLAVVGLLFSAVILPIMLLRRPKAYRDACPTERPH